MLLRPIIVCKCLKTNPHIRLVSNLMSLLGCILKHSRFTHQCDVPFYEWLNLYESGMENVSRRGEEFIFLLPSDWGPRLRIIITKGRGFSHSHVK